jgi:excisionase family DNA binding protein
MADDAALTLNLEEAGRLLGIGRDKMYRLAQAGELPGLIHTGKSWRMSRKGLERMLEEGWEAEPAQRRRPQKASPTRRRGRPPLRSVS